MTFLMLQEGKTELTKAAELGKEHYAEGLLKLGADVNVQDAVSL